MTRCKQDGAHGDEVARLGCAREASILAVLCVPRSASNVQALSRDLFPMGKPGPHSGFESMLM
jgi:hypothetical protein